MTCSSKDLARQVFAEFQLYFLRLYHFHEICCFDEGDQIWWVGYWVFRQPYVPSPLITNTNICLQYQTFTVTKELFRVYVGDRKWVSISSIHTGTLTKASKTLTDRMRKVLRRGLTRAVIEEVARCGGDVKWDWSNTIKVVIDRTGDLYISIHFDFNPKTEKVYVRMPVRDKYVTYAYPIKHYTELSNEIRSDILKVATDWREKIAALKAL